ncbi:MAG: UbiA family prenyltransferase [Acidobacteria bacterium]|nr:UbiA family prenyltransferase [Acidobacteriota bacterium]
MVGSEVSVPLVVDVDGTLVRGGLLSEAVTRLAAVSPLAVLSLLLRAALSIVDGGAAVRRRLALLTPPLPATLSLNEAVTAEIAAARQAGRQIWLASGADGRLVAPLAEAVGAAGWLASGRGTMLVGAARSAVLVERFGEGGFDYVGSRRRDLPVWRRARRAVGVGLSRRLSQAIRALDGEARLLPGSGGRALDYVLALRPHQWIKNAVVFGPIVAAHETRPELYLVVAGLFGALSAAASGGYLLNDLFDLPYDRAHQRKRRRPLAAGRLPLLPAGSLGVALVAGGVAAAFGLSAAAGGCVAAYVLLTFAYSLVLKRRVFVDVAVLALLFTVRTLAGAAAIAVPVSTWFLAFAFFVFLALAILKRQGELSVLRATGKSALPGRAYTVEDRAVLAGFAAASGMASVVVLALYIQSPEVRALYGRPEVLWLVGPLLVTWLGRMTLLADRGRLGDDPVLFAVGDRVTWLTTLAAGAAAACAAVL